MNRFTTYLRRSLLLIFLSTFLGVASGEAQSPRGTYVTTSEVEVRKGPGINHEVVATIPKDIKVDVVGKEGYWLKIESKHGGKPGYIDEQYARPLNYQQTAQAKPGGLTAAGPYRTLEEVDLREGPGTQHRIVAKLPAGIKVNVVRAEGDWLRVESKKGNRPGYVQRRFVERWTER
jgi:uncharacterized protein YgiM (DUF1202 family)